MSVGTTCEVMYNYNNDFLATQAQSRIRLSRALFPEYEEYARHDHRHTRRLDGGKGFTQKSV